MMAKIKDRAEKNRIFDDRISTVWLFGHHLYDDLIFGQNLIGLILNQPFVWPILQSILTKLTERDRAIYYQRNIN